MPKRTRPFRDALLEDLLDPREAAHYINAALTDSDDTMLLVALRDVAEAHQISAVARESGLSRESVYRMLSENGNPTLASLSAILQALNLRFAIEADIPQSPSTTPPSNREYKSAREAALPTPASKSHGAGSNVVDIGDYYRTLQTQEQFARKTPGSAREFVDEPKYYRAGGGG
jgi:probable addiction module antidote protein